MTFWTGKYPDDVTKDNTLSSHEDIQLSFGTGKDIGGYAQVCKLSSVMAFLHRKGIYLLIQLGNIYYGSLKYVFRIIDEFSPLAVVCKL